MHEQSLVRSLLRQVEQIAIEHRATAVSEVFLTIGEFSGVEAALVESAYELQSAKTLARGSQLHVCRVPLAARCDGCRHEFALQRFEFVCPNCAGRQVVVIRGEELLLDRVTLEAPA